MNRQLAVTVLLVAVAAALLAPLVARYRTPAPLERATLLDAPRPLPAFSLIDQDERGFTRDRLRGAWTLMFFGFTHCPGVCPTTLATLAQARGKLADLSATDQPRVVLVSVDPRRDTPGVLATYVTRFDPEFLGVTGSADSIAAMARELGVAALSGPPTGDGNYMVEHTASIFLIDPSAALAAVFARPHAADVIARDYRAIVAERR